MTDLRPIPSPEHAAGMLAALTSGHQCGEACTGTITLGDGTVLRLTCPYTRFDLTSEIDRRIIGGLYASEALGVMVGAR